MDSLVLDAIKRGQGKARDLRTKGLIPAVYYGKSQANMSLALAYQAFKKIFDKAGENTIIELNVDGKKIPVLVYDIQYDPVSDRISHVDFIHVDMQKEVTTSVKVVIIGTAPAVKNMGGILDIQKHEIKIKCLPKDLIHGIEVDVTPIVDFKTSVHVKDLKVPSTIKILDNMEDTVVTATPPRAEEETKPAETAAAAVPGAEGAVVQGAVPATAGTAPAASAPVTQPVGKK